MSSKIMGAVWELDLSHSQQLVLLAMADHADHEGNSIYPSIGLIAWKTGYSERQATRIVSQLVASGILIEVKPSSAQFPTTYRIELAAARKKSPHRGGSRKLETEKRSKLLDLLFEKVGQVCQYCHQSGDKMLGPDGQKWNIDRIVPGNRGGEYTIDNITLSCATCNRKKKNRVLSIPAAAPLSQKTPNNGDVNMAPLSASDGIPTPATMAPQNNTRDVTMAPVSAQNGAPTPAIAMAPKPSLEPSFKEVEEERNTASDLRDSNEGARSIQAELAILNAMVAAMPKEVRPAVPLFNERDIETAHDLAKQGYTPERVTAYVQWAYENDSYLISGSSDGLMMPCRISKVAQRIGAYEAHINADPDRVDYLEIDELKCEHCGRLERYCTCDADEHVKNEPIPQHVLNRWTMVKGQLEIQLGRNTYNTWVKRIAPVEVRDGTLVLGAPDRYAKDWWNKHLLVSASETFGGMLGGGNDPLRDMQLEVVVAEEI